VAADGASRPPNRTQQLAQRRGELRDLGYKVRGIPAAGASPELAARREDLLRRVDAATARVEKRLEARRELEGMAREGKALVAEYRDPATSAARRAELRGEIEKKKAAFGKRKEELKAEVARTDAAKGAPDAEDPCAPCLEKDAKALEDDARKENEKKLKDARDLCDVKGTADEADKELVARELAKMPQEALDEMKENGTRVAVCRGSVTDHKKDLSGFTPRGWPEGTDWKTVPGCYDNEKNEVIVATRGHGTPRGAHVPEWGDGHGAANLAIHEAYHAIDYQGGKVSSSSAFGAVRQTDYDHLPEYCHQPGEAGLEESYAEGAARYYGNPSDMEFDQPAIDGYFRGRPRGGAAAGDAK